MFFYTRNTAGGVLGILMYYAIVKARYLQYEFVPHYEEAACIDLKYKREGKSIKRLHPRIDDVWIASDILLHLR